MRRSSGVVGRLLWGQVHAESTVAAQQYSTVGNYSFARLGDAPQSSPSGQIKYKISGAGEKDKGNKVMVTVSAGSASGKAEYAASEVAKSQSTALTLYDTPRISVLHASLLEYLLKLTNERYNILSTWPDFTTMYGKDVYYRAHPEDIRKFFAQIDEFHRLYDVITEVGSLSGIASELIPKYRRLRMNVMHPFATPTPANAVVTQFLLSGGK